MTRIIISTAILCVAGTIGGWIASILHLPMPWMLGSLTVATLIAMVFPSRLGSDYKFPNDFRQIFIAVIGMTIGFQVHWDLIQQIPHLIASLIGITLFVPIAYFVNFQIFKRIGGYDDATAFFSGAPGGLMEAIAMGEDSGANIGLLTLQQFLRIIIVIAIIPFGISLWVGAPVGSAAGLASQMPLSEWSVVPTLISLAIMGFVGNRVALRFRLPAGHLLGPLIAAAALNLTELVELAVPVWALVLAQVVIGASLGARFLGMSIKLVLRSLWLGAISVAAMLAIGGLFSLLLIRLTSLQFDALLIAFAPGGVTEMSLIAVSLAVSPAIVTVHHLYRILLTVAMMAWMKRRILAH